MPVLQQIRAFEPFWHENGCDVSSDLILKKDFFCDLCLAKQH